MKSNHIRLNNILNVLNLLVMTSISVNTFASDAIANTSFPPVKVEYKNPYLNESGWGSGFYIEVDNRLIVPLDVNNTESEKAAIVKANCVVNYDQNERFPFQTEPTKSENFAGILKTRTGSQVMWPGHTEAQLAFKVGYAKVDTVQCSLNEVTLIEGSPIFKFFRELLADI